MNQDLHAKVAMLESKLDYLESEMQRLNEMLIDCGFPEGITTLKATVTELLEEGIGMSMHPRKSFFDGL
ncbi:MAG: hypothetical protein WCG14_00735 [Chlamydiia bacterium]|nr:hypothetical protein [Chlamydiota bacterium]